MGPGLIKASNSSRLRDAAAAIQTTPKANAKNQASGEPSPGTVSAKNHAPASTQKIAPTHHNSCHADDALMTPSTTAASRSAPPRWPCLTPPRKPEGCPHEEGFDRPVHAVARAARSCWHSPDHLPLYLTERGSPVFGFCIRLHGICYLVETVDATEHKRKVQPLRYFTFIGSRDLFRWALESSFVEQSLHG